MGREVWVTHSVRDDLQPEAFVADVMLYDRLVIPVPDGDAEVARWRKASWDPDAQGRPVAVLGERARPVPWNAERREAWRQGMNVTVPEGQEVGGGDPQGLKQNAFFWTRTLLTHDLHAYVTGVESYMTYSSLEAI